MDKRNALRYRIEPLEMTPSEFRKVGRQLVEHITEFVCTLHDRRITPDASPRVIQEALGTGSLPEQGTEVKDLLEEAASLLFAHSTFTGHPRFLGFITSSAAPIGALADLLVTVVNPEVKGAWCADRHCHRGPDRALDGRNDRLPGGLRWSTGERWHDGRFHRLAGGS